jgi:gluconolactonase
MHYQIRDRHPLQMLAPLFVCVFATSIVQAQPAPQYRSLGKIERLDPQVDALVPPDARMEVLASGFTWSEGPVWVKEGGYLLFSDIPRNSVFKWKEAEGISLFLHPSGFTGNVYYGKEPGCNGLLLDPAGRLVSMEHGDRRVSVLYKDGGKRTLVDNYQGKRLNSPNDGVFKSNGDLYFTDPPYGLPDRINDPRKELDFQGIYRLSKDGTLTLLTKEVKFPNGIGFSPDEKTLYVAQSDPTNAVWYAFDVKDDGTLGDSRIFFDMTGQVGKRPGLPDGLKVDRSGNLFATGPGGVHIFSPAGKHLGTLATGERTANCGWGEDGSTLFICADSHIARIRLTTKGLGIHLADGSDKKARSVAEKLDQMISVDFRRDPLFAAVAFVAKAIDLPITINGDDLKMVGVTQNTQQNFKMQNVPAKAVLDQILTHEKLVIVLGPDGQSVLVTSAPAAKQRREEPLPLK